nr:magnesium protoporphyrin IX methyltransferase [Marinibacterium profundimaris]
MDYARTLTRVETYFDRTALHAWERLTSDAPVSRIRETVRRGRDEMRALMLARLPEDLSGARVLDAGCGTGQMSWALAARGADVVAADISPALIEIARQRMPAKHLSRVTFRAGDMLDAGLGRFDHVIAMDSLLYYDRADTAAAVAKLGARCSGRVIFTVAPRTPLLMAMWQAGQLFPRADRSPTMVPQSAAALAQALRDTHASGALSVLDRVSSGFYISQAMEYAS